MKRIVLLISLIITSTAGLSQNILQGDADRDLDIAAKEAAESWAEKLAMSAKQTALMEDKLVEYALKKKVILNSKMREEAKTQRLLALELEENKSMRDILTKPQYERYLFLLKQEVKQKSAPEHRDSIPQEE